MYIQAHTCAYMYTFTHIYICINTYVYTRKYLDPLGQAAFMESGPSEVPDNRGSPCRRGRGPRLGHSSASLADPSGNKNVKNTRVILAVATVGSVRTVIYRYVCIYVYIYMYVCIYIYI